MTMCVAGRRRRWMRNLLGHFTSCDRPRAASAPFVVQRALQFHATEASGIVSGPDASMSPVCLSPRHVAPPAHRRRSPPLASCDWHAVWQHGEWDEQHQVTRLSVYAPDIMSLLDFQYHLSLSTAMEPRAVPGIGMVTYCFHTWAEYDSRSGTKRSIRRVLVWSMERDAESTHSHAVRRWSDVHRNPNDRRAERERRRSRCLCLVPRSSASSSNGRDL